MRFDELTGSQTDLSAAAERAACRTRRRPSETFRTRCRHSERGVHPSRRPHFAPNENGLVGCGAEGYVRIDKEDQA